MAHVPESVETFVCTSCQVIHAGTPVHESGATHSWEQPSACGSCSANDFVPLEEWARHHE